MAKMSIPILVDWESIKDYFAKSDIEEVIRCKDCKYAYKGIKSYTCQRVFKPFTIEEDGFCSWAERKEE